MTWQRHASIPVTATEVFAGFHQNRWPRRNMYCLKRYFRASQSLENIFLDIVFFRGFFADKTVDEVSIKIPGGLIPGKCTDN